MGRKRKNQQPISTQPEGKEKTNLSIQFVDEKDMKPPFQGEKKPLPDNIDMCKVMRIDPVTRLRNFAADKRLAAQKIALLQSEIKRAESEIATILCAPGKYSAEILAMVTSADDIEGRIVAGIATLDQINSLQYKAGYGELFTAEPV